MQELSLFWQLVSSKMDKFYHTYRFEVKSILVIMFLYMINKILFIPNTEGTLQWFCICYVNDLMAPVLLLNVLTILFQQCDLFLFRYQIILIIGIVAGLCWEYFIPLIKANAVADVYDLICYLIGTHLYYFSYRWIKKDGQMIGKK